MSKEKGAKSKKQETSNRSKTTQHNNSSISFFSILILLIVIVVVIGLFAYKFRLSKEFNASIDSLYGIKTAYQKFNDKFKTSINTEQENQSKDDILVQYEDNLEQGDVTITTTHSDLTEQAQIDEPPTDSSDNQQLTDQELTDQNKQSETAISNNSNNQDNIEQDQNGVSNQAFFSNTLNIDDINNQIAKLESDLAKLEKTLAENNTQINQFIVKQEVAETEKNTIIIEQLNIFRKMIEIEMLAKQGLNINNQLDYLSKYVNIEPKVYDGLQQAQPSEKELADKLENLLPRALAFEKTGNNNNLLYPLYIVLYSIFTISNDNKTLASLPLKSFQEAIANSDRLQILAQQLQSKTIEDSHPLKDFITLYEQIEAKQQLIDVLWQNVSNTMTSDR